MGKKSLGNTYNEYKKEFPSKILEDIGYKDVFVSLPSVTPRINKFKDIEVIAKFADPNFIPDPGLSVTHAREIIDELNSLHVPWRKDEWEMVLRNLAQKLGISAKDLFMELRRAVTGSEIGPDLFESIEYIGEEKTLERLRRFLKV